MQFSVTRSSFLGPLLRYSGVVERKNTMPIIGNLLLVVKNRLLSITGTDLEIELVSRVILPEDSKCEDGATTVNARKLIDICKALPDNAVISFNEKEQKATLRAGRSRYTLACLGAKDFPQFEGGLGTVEFSITQAELSQLIEKVAFVMAQEDVRYFLNGMCLYFGPQEIRAVAADGHRLATVAIEGRPLLQEQRSIILPRKAVLELQRLLGDGGGDVGITIGENHFRAATTDYSFCTKLVEGKFPDYRKVLPPSLGQEMLAQTEELKSALTHVSVLFFDRFRGAMFKLQKGELTIQASSPDKDEVEDVLPVTYDANDIEIGLNVSYVLEILNAIKAKQVKMSFQDSDHSVIFESHGGVTSQSEAIYVVMPMTI